MNESEQAQAIAEIKERVIDCPKANQMDLEDIAFSKLDREKLLEIVDSQAQKIAQLTKERDAMTATAYRLVVDEQQHISEARKIAEKMRDASERPGGGHTLLPWEKQ